MTVTRENLGGLLDQVCHDEPPVHDGVEAVFRRAEAIRRRRLRTVIGAGISAVVLVAALGYVLTTAIVPAPANRRAAAPAATPAPRADPALLAVRAAVDDRLRVVPREPVRGEGWRQYTVLDLRSGRPGGLIEISVYAAPGRLCFPVLADEDACARPERFGDDVEYVRYTDDRDVDWQVHQVIARRLTDGRVVAVTATGERGTGDATAGRPPLTASQTAALASNPGLMAAFGADERCNGPDPACPVLAVPVPVD
jgi:hypothetical protein